MKRRCVSLRLSVGLLALPLTLLACSSSPSDRGTPCPAVEGLLIDDFEDGDTAASVPGEWYAYTDDAEGGLSTLDGGVAASPALISDGCGSSRAIEISYALDRGALPYVGYVGLGVALGDADRPWDASAYGGLAYAYRGAAHRVRLKTTEVQDSAYFGTNLPSASGWTSVILPFEALFQESSAERVPFSPAHVTALDFIVYGAGESGRLAVDDVSATKAGASTTPDLVVRDPEPPIDDSIDSVASSNPLQAKALRYLNRGYNIGGWLEQERFTTFRYDEAFVAKLSAAGFKALRLPIDLDLYVEKTTGSGDELSVEVSPDLFTVLDAFDAWTAAHGLSLTIDYHQYSTLLNSAVPDSISTAVSLWRAVAEHFADNEREDLFLELLNEPELAFDGRDPTESEWTSIAERMIAAIRDVDSRHSIIFGGTHYYGIDTLTARTPLSDSNVIYAFHTYSPYLFTHQGAEWAGMGSLHDIPYPYDRARWSDRSVSFGFISSTDPGILGLAGSYYRDGSRSALRNKILSAKRWGLANDAPVICNEFGAYGRTSRLEDRARYYEDTASIFAELEIPWQLWFGVMDRDGSVPTELQQALRLAP